MSNFRQMSVCRQTTKNKGWGNKTFLVRLEKLSKRSGFGFAVKRSFFNSVNEKLRFGSRIMPRVTVTVFCKKKRKNDNFRFLRGPVCQIFDKCQFVGKRQKIKGGAIKRFLFGLKSWLKKWVWFCPIVKIARFHPTKHLS